MLGPEMASNYPVCNTSMAYFVKLGTTVVKTTVINTVPQLDQSLAALLDSIRQNVSSVNSKGVFVWVVNKTAPKCVVGLGIEKDFRPSSSNRVSEKVAVVKICYGTSCLVIQLLHLKEAPCSLSKFLQHRGLSFVGVGIWHCLEALERDYGIKCRNAVDLGRLAATVKKKKVYREYGLLDLVGELGASNGEKLLLIDSSLRAECLSGNWGSAALSEKQIEAATSDAFVCVYLADHLLGVHLTSVTDSESEDEIFFF